MTLNPFRPGAGHTPPEFAGRQEPLNTFTNILRRTEIGAISLSRKRNGEECIYSSSHPPG